MLYITVPGADFSGRGLPNAFSFLPFQDNLYAAYLLGSDYSEGDPADDRSGNERPMSMGASVVTPWGHNAPDNVYPVTPFTPNDLGSGQATLITVASVPVGAVNLSLSKSGTVAPFIGLVALPGASQVTVQQNTGVSTISTVLSGAGALRGQYSFYAGTFDGANNKVYGQAPGGPLLVASAAAPGPVSGSVGFRSGDTSGTPTSAISIAAQVYYDRALSAAELAEVRLALGQQLIDYGSPIDIIG